MTNIASCVFCRPQREFLAEGAHSLAFFDSFPVSEGHALIVPKRHVVTIWDMNADEYVDAFQLVREVKALLMKRYDPAGFNVGVNCGEAAGQSVWHAHIHLIPRYLGDMPTPRGGVRNIIPGKGNY